ncbi:hypothetical protein DP145_03100 [Clostridium tetani]|uniref:ATP-binding protein n=1 Tax=Clostridium tetani TaxID=1513 RepID=UPI00100ACDC9|nr:ATP-binding protein [Clostridium tetani]RXI47756.1 hypothetical protein DP126_00395 [Clostridium tetani]RXM61166.1 hypothetical protein DP138_06030 [Clostridium tetani]RXM69692.1 hypothetical protein DP145_03100 [Clostridium tetani]
MYKRMLKELIEIEEIQNLMEKLYSIVGISHSILDLDGNLIVGIGEKGIYKSKNTKEYFSYNQKYDKKEEYFLLTCKEGTKKVVSPIKVKEEKIGYIVTEDFFTKEEDKDHCKTCIREDLEYINYVEKIPVINEEQVKNTIIYQRDLIDLIINKKITDLSYEENAYAKMRHKFFANLSHEFRTPITVILSSLYMCEIFLKKTQEDILDIKVTTYLKNIKKNAYRLLRLINNLIDMTKINCGELILFKENNDIVNIVEETTLRVAKYVYSKNIDIVFDTDMEEKIIACDKEKIERIILNLLSNAVKFTPRGGRILVQVENTNDFVRISVEDTGIGIPEEEKDLIFEPFTQVDKGFSRIAEGSGIGLPIIKSLVEMHKGMIWVESICGEGSKFFIELPNVTIEDCNNANGKVQFSGGEENTHIEFSDIYF